MFQLCTFWHVFDMIELEENLFQFLYCIRRYPTLTTYIECIYNKLSQSSSISYIRQQNELK